MYALSLEEFNIIGAFGYSRAIQFLFVSNVIFVSTYLLAFFYMSTKISHSYMILIMFVVFNLLLIFTFTGSLPVLYITDVGFTVTKTYSDYFIILSLFLILILLVTKKESFEQTIYTHQLVAISSYIISEVLLLFQTNRFGLVFLLSLCLKAFVYFVLVRGFIGELLLKKIHIDYDILSNTIEKLNNQVLESQKNENIFKTLYEDAPLGYQSLDINGNFLYVNETYSKMLGYKKDEMLGRFFGDFMDKESHDELPIKFAGFKKRGAVDVIFSMTHKKGYSVPIRFIGKIAYKEEGEFKQTHCILMDVSNELEYQKGIVESKNKLDGFIDGLELSSYIVNKDFECTYVNNKLLLETGYTEEELLGRNIHKILHHSYANGDPYPIEECVVYKSINHNYSYKNVKEIIWSKEQVIIEVIITTKPIIDNDQNLGVMVTMRNSSQAHNIMQALIRMSYHDTLTGIFNRRYYQDELHNIDIESNLPLSIIVSDINGLKLINDAFGHVCGDTLIKNAVKVFIKFAVNSDLLARVGGDEFVIVMPKTNEEEAKQRISLMNKEASNYKINSIELSVSYGTATKSTSSQSFDDIYTAAEDMMYRDKLINVPTMRSSAIERIITTLNEMDPYAKEHSESVSAICELISVKLGYNQEFITEMRLAGLLHDIGKIILPKELLQGTKKLSTDDIETFRKHSEVGFRILNSSSHVRMLSQYVLCHHENMDGSGYPQGLRGNRIPIQSRIIGVSGAIEVMTSEHNYNNTPKTKEEVILELKNCSGTQFDPMVVDIAIEYIDEIIQIVKSK
jgi:diguanylate cyclase (GGDEF)-like protein/PAS domain S-box-containing protein